MDTNRHARTLMLNSLEVLDQRIVPSSLGASVAAHEAAMAARTPVAIDIHFSGVTSKTLKSFEKELTSDKVKLGSISLSTHTAVGTAPKSELAAIAKLRHVTKVSMISPTVPPTAFAAATTSTSTSTPIATPTPVMKSIVALPVSRTTTTTTTTSTSTPTIVSSPVVSDNPATTPSSSLVSTKGGPVLGTIYQEYLTYVQGGSTGTFSPPQAKQYFITGTSIDLDVSVPVADMASAVAMLQAQGMNILATATPGQVAVINGYLPIANLPAVAADADIISMPPTLRPTPF